MQVLEVQDRGIVSGGRGYSRRNLTDRAPADGELLAAGGSERERIAQLLFEAL